MQSLLGGSADTYGALSEEKFTIQFSKNVISILVPEPPTGVPPPLPDIADIFSVRHSPLRISALRTVPFANTWPLYHANPSALRSVDPQIPVPGIRSIEAQELQFQH